MDFDFEEPSTWWGVLLGIIAGMLTIFIAKRMDTPIEWRIMYGAVTAIIGFFVVKIIGDTG